MEYRDGDRIPEVWFIREKYVLEDALKESINRKITNCCYYPGVEASLNLSIQKEMKRENIVQIKTKGLIQMEDKIALIINHGYEKNMTTKEVEDTIKDNNFKLSIKEKQMLKIEIDDFSKKIDLF